MEEKAKPQQSSFLKRNFLFISVIVMLGLGYLAFRANSSTSASAADLQRSLTSGQPTVMEIYDDT